MKVYKTTKNQNYIALSLALTGLPYCLLFLLALNAAI